jgi:hypothetical protein
MPEQRPPFPCDEDAESVVLSAALHEPDTVDVSAAIVSPVDFFFDPNRVLWEHVVALRAEGALDVRSLVARLRSHGLLERVGGTTYIGNLAGLAGDPEASARIVHNLARLRRAEEQLTALATEARSGRIPDVDAWLGKVGEKLERVVADRAGKRFEVLTGASLASKLPDREFLVEALGIGPGPYTLVAGLGFSRKTLSVQAMAATIATGIGLVWNRFEASQGRVVHVDYDQGAHLTVLRYQRLALAMHVWGELWDNLDVVANTTKPYLDAPGSLRELEKLCVGRKLCIIDALRGAFSTIDENSSEIRTWLDKLSQISMRTGCTVLVIHHGRKPSKNDMGEVSGSGIRGSTAIFDGAESVFELEKTGAAMSDPVQVRHKKARFTGETVEPFLLDALDPSIPVEEIPAGIVDVTDVKRIRSECGTLRRGLAVVAVDAQKPVVVKVDPLVEMSGRILEVVRARPGITSDALEKESKVGASTRPLFRAALNSLLTAKSIWCERIGKAKHYRETTDFAGDDEDEL